MSPQEFWTLADEKRKSQRIGGLTVREYDELLEGMSAGEGGNNGG